MIRNFAELDLFKGSQMEGDWRANHRWITIKGPLPLLPFKRKKVYGSSKVRYVLEGAWGERKATLQWFDGVLTCSLETYCG